LARYTRSVFGRSADGTEVALHTLRNACGAQVAICDYGATIASVTVFDRHGALEDVVLGYDTLTDYEQCQSYMGCIVGPVANRIAGARFTLDGKPYQVDKNDGDNHLHSGSAGLHQHIWHTQVIDNALVMTTCSPDGAGGYPGNLSVEVRYRWTDNNELCIDYLATTDKPTVVNLASHAYFNLSGHQRAGAGGVLAHQLQLLADKFLPTAADNIPLGRMDPVADTPMDFSVRRTVGDCIENHFEQLSHTGGYDHCWVINTGQTPAVAAVLIDPFSGRRMTVSTTQPGVQLYTANHLDNLAGKGGQRYGRHGALCLETQHFPDAVNRPEYPSVVLRPDEQYRQATVYRFDLV
jgi:aldose 1-epimerase